jgi:hypothetical protein
VAERGNEIAWWVNSPLSLPAIAGPLALSGSVLNDQGEITETYGSRARSSPLFMPYLFPASHALRARLRSLGAFFLEHDCVCGRDLVMLPPPHDDVAVALASPSRSATVAPVYFKPDAVPPLAHRRAAGKVGRTLGACETPSGPFPSTEATVAKDNSQTIAVGAAAP